MIKDSVPEKKMSEHEYEKNISTKQYFSQKNTWFSCKDVNKEWQACYKAQKG